MKTDLERLGSPLQRPAERLPNHKQRQRSSLIESLTSRIPESKVPGLTASIGVVLKDARGT